MNKSTYTLSKVSLLTLGLSLFSLACGSPPEPIVDSDITGIEVRVNYDSNVAIDQLKIQGWATPQQSAFEPATLPEVPQRFDATEQSFVILLPDELAQTTIRIDVDAYFAGEQVAAGQQTVTIVLSKLVQATVRLSVDNVCNNDMDNDGICDENDPCIDLDGDGFGTGPLTAGCPHQNVDLDDTNSLICADTDVDSCDDCSQGTFDPRADGADGDGDGICDQGDACTDADLDGFGTGTLNNSGCEHRSNDVDDYDFTQCTDSDEDGCDDCSEGAFNPAADGSDLDEDGVCDLTDTCTDFDGDGIGVSSLNREGCDEQSITDSDDRDATLCADTDQDGCDDCFTGEFNPANDGIDADADGICDLNDACVDLDGDGIGNGTQQNAGCASPLVDSNDQDPQVCGDTDNDTCDDCSSGSFAPSNDGEDYDSDGTCDLADLCFDADGDGFGTGIANNAGCTYIAVDLNDQDPNRCSDLDSDNCDDCSSGSFDMANDGPDSDNDGLCDIADLCVDLDGDGVGDGTGNNLGCVSAATDIDDSNPTLCTDSDGDGCDDCSSGSFNPNTDGEDSDNDGVCNFSDTCTDKDGDGFGDDTLDISGCPQESPDSNDSNASICADTDNDTCDDCSSGLFNTSTDGEDLDNDGICDAGDECTDFDGDGLGNGTLGNSGCINSATDTNDNNISQCADTDNDTCDDCINGNYSPQSDGPDWDGDGLCNAGDTCTDKDGDGFGATNTNNSDCTYSAYDVADNQVNLCTDSDDDGCDDCSQGPFNPNNDGADTDFDGICNVGDTCTDADQDGLGVGSQTSGCQDPTVDSNDSSATTCADTDNDGCDDCFSGQWDPNNDGLDSDGDGICDLGDVCADNDGDGICVEQDCDDNNPYCTTVCTDADADGFCSNYDCDETYPTCTLDCSTNSDAATEPTPMVDCIELFCGADPYDGTSNCYIANNASELSDALSNTGSGQTNIIVGNVEINADLPQVFENTTVTQEPGTSITVNNGSNGPGNSGTLFEVRGENTRFENLVIYVEQADMVFDITADSTEIDGVSIISMEINEPREAIDIASSNNIVENSQIFGFEERGIEIKGNNANGNQILDNIITGGTDAAQLEKAAILVELGSDNSIIGNVLVDNTMSAVMLRRANNTRIAHNTVANNFNGVTFTSDGNWDGFEQWKSTNTCMRNNSVTGNNAGISQYYTYTTWDESAACAAIEAAQNAYGNNSFGNTVDCNPSCDVNIPPGSFWEYAIAPNYKTTTKEATSVPPGYYCLGSSNPLEDAARDLGYDRNGLQAGDYNGALPDVGGRETGTNACPE